jgi:hypothetical protein
VRRDISSIPFQTASATWQQIVGLITGKDSEEVGQLTAATGAMASIITDEHLARRAVIVEGVGAQLRIYCRHGMKAVEAGGAVDGLPWNPTAGDWTMHVPCDGENIDWVRESLGKTSPRIKVFDVAEEERAESESTASKVDTGVTVDWNFGG